MLSARLTSSSSNSTEGLTIVIKGRPVRLLTSEELAGRADAVFGDVLAALTAGPAL